jgi:hypothetical protein
VSQSQESRSREKGQLRFILLTACEPYAEPDQTHALSSPGKRLAQERPELVQGGREAGALNGCAGEIREFQFHKDLREGIAAFNEKRPPNWL